MLHLSVIGNLGADAEVKNFNSGDYVSFRVAHNYKVEDKDRTLWVSCLMRGNGGKLLEYLKRGATVFVTGRGTLRTFSSHVTKQWEVGADCSVDRLELISTQKKVTPESIKAALDSGDLSADALKEFISEQPF